MTLNQLDILGTLMRADKTSLSYLSAKLVLIDGNNQIETAKILDTKANTVNNGVKRYKEAHLAVKKAYCS